MRKGVSLLSFVWGCWCIFSVLVGLVLLIGFVVNLAGGFEPEPAQPARQSPLPPAAAARAERQRAERAAELAGRDGERQQTPAQRGEVAARVTCPRRVERLAHYALRWTDGFLEPKFSHSRPTGKPDVVTYIGDSIEFQNGFGAWQPHVYECDLNVVTEQVVDVRARPGRLR